MLTQDGPKSFKNIQIGDQVLGLNLQSGVPEFSEVISWLHRETDASL